ncbi:LacI family DNA-binding transcriptional regulator [Kribbella sp. NPDC056861]|uniref:LacI family DNA-binding transcriptional regulator n=1 Tax=Kribbella sp. NPDC056861 TaxID=3154857 RepID=UPI003418B4BD
MTKHRGLAVGARVRAPTLEQVAVAAGVSRATVSRVVNGAAQVRDDKIDRVKNAIARLGYVPNRAARALVTQRADSIALLLPGLDLQVLSDPLFAGLLRGVGRTLAATSSQLVVLFEDDPRRLVRYLGGGHVDGAIVVSQYGDPALLRQLARQVLPVVFSAPVPGCDVPVGQVEVDDVAAARAAVGHLLSIGCRRIGTVAGRPGLPSGQDRLTGYREAVAAAGLPVVQEFGGACDEEAERAVATLLAEHPDLDGLFVASDVMARAVLRMLAAHGRRVPDDVAVVVFDDRFGATGTVPALTAVGRPSEALGACLAEMLLGDEDEILTDSSATQSAVPDRAAFELVVRDST